MAYGNSKNSRSSRLSNLKRPLPTSPKLGINRPSISMEPQIDDNQLLTGFTPTPLNLNKAQANSEKISLYRDVFDKTAFNNTVDTNFSQLDQEAPDLSFFDPNLATIEDFFNIYQNLFYQIPKFGDILSHQYLVVESTAYTNFIENQQQIDALLEEITDLREENLQLNLDLQQILGAKESIDQLIRQNPNGDRPLDEILQDEAELGALQGNSSSDNLGTPNSNNTTAPSGGGGGGGGGGGFTGGGSGNLGEIVPFGNGNFNGGFGFGNQNPNSNFQQNQY